MELTSIKYTQQQIDEKRTLIAKLFMEESINIKSSDIKIMSVQDVELLFKLYDREFFSFWFRDSFKGSFRFSLSKRMTKSAGMTVCPRNITKMKPEDVVIDIKIGIAMILSYGVLEDSTRVGGIQTTNSLQALQLVLEHEIVHAIEFITYGRSSCKASRFKTMAKNIFGHAESTHSLATPARIAYEDLGIRPGSTVTFSFEGKGLSGIVSNVNKRATVMVADRKGIWQDSKGKRYSKYYVPLNGLKIK